MTYPFRRVGYWLASPNWACHHKDCARPWAYQGLIASKWCKIHNARIMAGESTDDWPRKKRWP